MRLRCVCECRGAARLCVRESVHPELTCTLSSRHHICSRPQGRADCGRTWYNRTSFLLPGWAHGQSCARPDAQARQIALGESERFYFELLHDACVQSQALAHVHVQSPRSARRVRRGCAAFVCRGRAHGGRWARRVLQARSLVRCPACSHRGYDSFSDICGAWLGFGSGFGIGFALTLLLARAPLLLATLFSHTIPSPAFTSVWWSVSLVHTRLGSSYLIAHVLHYPPPPTLTAL
jgi:hypothetical protein